MHVIKGTVLLAVVFFCVAPVNSFAGDGGRRDGMDLMKAAPALARFKQDVVMADLWKRPQLSPRDRSIVTVSALIARHHLTEMASYVELALDSGVKPSEISEIMTHLAFYSGWANALDAVTVKQKVFAARGVAENVSDERKPLPLDEQAEAKRADGVSAQFGDVAPGLVQYTTEVLFRDLWLRPELAPRDRSLITISALIASGQVAQIPYHLNRAMDTA